MTTPVSEKTEPRYSPDPSPVGATVIDDVIREKDPNYLTVETDHDHALPPAAPSPSQTREQANRLDDDLALLEAEQAVRDTEAENEKRDAASMGRTRSRRSEPVDEFDVATNPLHEQTAAYKPPEDPSTSLAKFVKQVHNSSFLVRYFTYIAPVVLLLLIPLLLGALVYKDANVGGVSLLWFSVWLEIVWLTLWAGRVRTRDISLLVPPSVPSTLANFSFFSVFRSLPNACLLPWV
jgi:hypothetical protein